MAAQKDGWREEEGVLGLHLYLRHRRERLGRGHPEVVALSETLRRLAERAGLTPSAVFRNEAGIDLQLGKFLNLEKDPKIKGRGEPAQWQREVWARYVDDPEALQRRVDEIMSTLDGPRGAAMASPPSEAREAMGRSSKVAREELFDVFGPERPEHPRARAEPIQLDSLAQDRADEVHDELRIKLRHFLVLYGFDVHNSRKARLGRAEVIRFDLAAQRESLTLLIEVKSLPAGGDDHDPLRKGLGQLLWYRSRWQRLIEDPCVAVLYVERKPVLHQEWLAACNDVGVVLAWPDRHEAMLEECTRLAELSALPASR